MTAPPWWQTGVIYQIAVPSFFDADGDGRGDLRGIMEKLDYLNDGTASSLGVGTIWLTPINTSPLNDFGYDVSDYYSINPIYGTMQVFDELVSACHERGMRVMMDLVLNHTSSEHPWFVESRSSCDNPRRDWYVWRDGRAPGRPPNEWLAVVEGSAWEYDEITGQYYYHAFLPFQPDLNWRNPEVKHEMLGVVRYWLDKGVDGFRLDLINFLYEDEQLRDNPTKLFGVRPYLAQKHLHDFSQPESLEIARDLRRLSDESGDRVLMGEICSDSREDCVAYLGDGTDRLHLSFYLDFIRQKWSAAGFRTSVQWLEEHLPPDTWPCYYLNNHDLPRTYTRLGGRGNESARAKVAAAMLLTLRGTPIIYYGEEIGMPESRVPRSVMDDPLGPKYWPLGVSRDGCRTPMQWSPGRNAGFTEGAPWLPVDGSYPLTNVELENGTPGSLLNWYRRLIHLRRAKAALHSGAYAPIEDVPRGVFAYTRQSGDETVAVLLNFTAQRAPVRAPGISGAAGAWRTLLSTHSTEGIECAPRLVLQPHEALILERT
ncbi:MAG: alpha-amylase family glycosyl hydrolase [Coriobacteriia bacterium]